MAIDPPAPAATPAKNDHNLKPRLLLGVVFLAFFGRLLSLGLVPLLDKTESRYGEIARIMAETGNWVTPQIDYGVPFWGKPPLSTWLSALAIKLFGVNEFAVRLPSLLLAAATIALVYALARQQKDARSAHTAIVVLCTSPMVFVAAGAVMTDPALMFATTLCMVGFYRALGADGTGGKLWGYLFFAGLGIGLLAKGPVAIVLTGIPIFFWTLWQNKWRQLWRQLPWLSGVLLTAALALPWFFWAEQRTPGFLDYFIIGEHWKRFVDPGWSGDLYGAAHSRPHGTIWLFWLWTAAPWSLLAPVAVLWRKSRQRLTMAMRSDRDWCRYLLLWTLAPMLFFSLAGNTLWTYVLPGLPAFALLIATLWPTEDTVLDRLAGRYVLVFSALVVVAVLALLPGLIPFDKSQKPLIAAYNQTAGADAQLVYLFTRPYSAQFYSQGKARFMETVTGDEPLFQNPATSYLALQTGSLSRLPATLTARLENQGTFTDSFTLYALRPQKR